LIKIGAIKQFFVFLGGFYHISYKYKQNMMFLAFCRIFWEWDFMLSEVINDIEARKK